MQALKSPRLFELHAEFGSGAHFGDRGVDLLRKNSLRVVIRNRGKLDVKDVVRPPTRTDKLLSVETSALCRNPLEVIRIGEHQNVFKECVRQAHASVPFGISRNSFSSSNSDAQETQALDRKARSTGKHGIRSKLAAMGLHALLLCAPGLVFTDIAEANVGTQLQQARQAGVIVEKAVEGISKFRFDGEAGIQVLDKALTVITGSTIVDPKVLDQKVESLIRGETDISEEFKETVLDTVQQSMSNLVDAVTNFNPSALTDSAGASIEGFLEAGVERFAALEISALVSLGERWLILTPLVVLPMAWQMRQNKKKSDERARDDQNNAEELAGEIRIRGERVKRELERIELKTLLLDAVNSLGEMALQPPRTRGESGLIRSRIQDILERLQELSPVDETSLLIPEIASSISIAAQPKEPMAYVPPTPTIDGDWRLIYVSEAPDGGDQELPQLPGIGLKNIRQKVWQSSPLSSKVENELPQPLSARNTVEVRFGPLGVLEIAVQGSWENLENGDRALVSFDTFSARPLEVLGNKITADLPQFDVAIPVSLQQRAEWGVLYVDNHIRINRGSRGQLFLFSKAD